MIRSKIYRLTIRNEIRPACPGVDYVVAPDLSVLAEILNIGWPQWKTEVDKIEDYGAALYDLELSRARP